MWTRPGFGLLWAFMPQNKLDWMPSSIYRCPPRTNNGPSTTFPAFTLIGRQARFRLSGMRNDKALHGYVAVQRRPKRISPDQVSPGGRAIRPASTPRASRFTASVVQV